MSRRFPVLHSSGISQVEKKEKADARGGLQPPKSQFKEARKRTVQKKRVVTLKRDTDKSESDQKYSILIM